MRLDVNEVEKRHALSLHSDIELVTEREYIKTDFLRAEERRKVKDERKSLIKRMINVQRLR